MQQIIKQLIDNKHNYSSHSGNANSTGFHQEESSSRTTDGTGHFERDSS